MLITKIVNKKTLHSHEYLDVFDDGPSVVVCFVSHRRARRGSNVYAVAIRNFFSVKADEGLKFPSSRRSRVTRVRALITSHVGSFENQVERGCFRDAIVIGDVSPIVLHLRSQTDDAVEDAHVGVFDVSVEFELYDAHELPISQHFIRRVVMVTLSREPFVECVEIDEVSVVLSPLASAREHSPGVREEQGSDHERLVG